MQGLPRAEMEGHRGADEGSAGDLRQRQSSGGGRQSRAARWDGGRRGGVASLPWRNSWPVPQVVFLVATIQQNARSFLKDLNFADELPYSGCLATKFKQG